MWFLPARTAAKKSEPVQIADLDALMEKSAQFKLHGKWHTIDPMPVEEFIKFSVAYTQFYELAEKSQVSPDELVVKYFEIAKTACKTITKEDIRKMSQQQVAGLFQILMDLHSGKIFADEKKTLLKVKELINS